MGFSSQAACHMSLLFWLSHCLFACGLLINFSLSLSDGFYRAFPQSARGTAVEFRSLLRAAAVRRVLRGSNATDISDSAAVAAGDVAQW